MRAVCGRVGVHAPGRRARAIPASDWLSFAEERQTCLSPLRHAGPRTHGCSLFVCTRCTFAGRPRHGGPGGPCARMGDARAKI